MKDPTEKYEQYYLYHIPSNVYVDGPFRTVKGAKAKLTLSGLRYWHYVGMVNGKHESVILTGTYDDFEVRKIVVNKEYVTSFSAAPLRR